jgi:hypothetical protein
MGVLSSLG